MPLICTHLRKPAIAVAAVLLSSCLCLAASTETTTTTSTHKPVAKHLTHHDKPISSHSHASRLSKKSHRRYASRKRGQQKIDPERTRQIQQALIREHYLGGEASGKWDAATQAALQKYQADNGWQSKSIPDSRALIKLGLGPDQRNLLNPESAMTSSPRTPHAAAGQAKAPDPSEPVEPQNQPQN